MIRFGSMSIILLLGALYGGLFAVMLWWMSRNRLANRFLACLLIVIALQLLPYIIGYAGFYDAFPWLSYLPYEASLAFGPLLYFYVYTLSANTLPKFARWHFVPVAMQVAYYAIIFPFPLEFKNNWNSTIHVPRVVPLEQIATFISMAVYWWLSFKRYRGYQAWLADHVSDREDHHIEWVRNFLIALGITLALWVGLAGFERLIAKLDYFQQFPFYVWLTVLAYYLGTEGYRHAGHRYPPWLDLPTDQGPPPEPIASAELAMLSPKVMPPVAMLTADGPALNSALKTGADWVYRGEKWRQQLIDQQWWRDPELTLTRLARKLGTNTSDLSRAINQGLGLNFNELINRLRVDEVKKSLANGDSSNNSESLLDIAFAAGFSSKASFNRSFKLYTGESPSAYRQRLA